MIKEIVKKVLEEHFHEMGFQMIVYDTCNYDESDILVTTKDEALDHIADRIIEAIVRQHLGGIPLDYWYALTPDNVSIDRR